MKTDTTKETSLIEALVAAQAEMPAIPLDGANPHFRSKFSTLLSVLTTITPVLNKHGIFFSQGFAFDAGAGPVLVTSLIKGDEKLTSMAPIPAAADVQKWAGSVTYIRRISALAICGCVGDPDADAEDVVRAPTSIVASTPGVDQISVEFIAKYVAAFRNPLATRNDLALLRAHEDLQGEGQVQYAAVWAKLGSAERGAIKEAIDRARKERDAYKAKDTKVPF